MQGRVHAYEGYAMAEVTFPMRVLGMLGCKALIVTNAAGGINKSYAQGGLVCISDHINLTGQNAAIGPNDPRFAIRSGAGLRFFDMTTAYSPRLRKLAAEEAARQNIPLPEGVYIAVLGPSYETAAEIRAFRTLGADLVGMSTVHEVIIARHMGVEVLGLSLVTNMAAGVLDQVDPPRRGDGGRPARRGPVHLARQGAGAPSRSRSILIRATSPHGGPPCLSQHRTEPGSSP